MWLFKRDNHRAVQEAFKARLVNKFPLNAGGVYIPSLQSFLSPDGSMYRMVSYSHDVVSFYRTAGRQTWLFTMDMGRSRYRVISEPLNENMPADMDLRSRTLSKKDAVYFLESLSVALQGILASTH